MRLDYYTWPPREPSAHATEPAVIETLPTLSLNDEARNYIPHPGLQAAVNLALVLSKPLLVTGEPGTGKTRLAESLGWQLGIKNLFKFVAKSTSTARDLLYSYDAIGRFYAAEAAAQALKQGLLLEAVPRNPSRAADFVTYAALGEAILRAHRKETVAHLLPPNSRHSNEPERSIVLIDEIDKALRDFPNDLLNELDLLRFRVPEVADEETPEFTNRKLRPIVIITSNREHNLPEPFLRRCIYFNIPFPELRGGPNTYTVENIVAQHLGTAGKSFMKGEFAGDAMGFFMDARSLSLDKRPATAELLDWFNAFRAMEVDPKLPLREQKELARMSLYALFKGDEDLKIGRRALEKWFDRGASTEIDVSRTG